MRKYILEITVFISGAIVMIFELAGSRILSPVLGNSIFVWSSLIGIILGSLSLGYYLGGKMSDKERSMKTFSLIILFSAIFVFITIFVGNFILNIFNGLGIDLRLKAVILSLILFAPASIFLGMISPYAVRLKLENLATSGSTIGNLYAISTLGSIFGTFMAGFFLIPFFGTSNIVIIIAVALVILSLVISLENKKIKIIAVLISIFVLLSMLIPDNVLAEQGVVEKDTRYNNVRIVDLEGVRYLVMEGGVHSAMYLNSDELHSEYLKLYNLAEHFNPNFKKSLIIGGAGYSYPKYYIENFKDKTIDVVEIDSGITKIARDYFNLEDSPRMNIFHEDGRIFLNQTEKKYDVIFGDAFSSYYSVPYHLTTKEAIQRKYDVLNDNGIVILNLISSIKGKKGQFFRAEYATYKEVFPQVYVFPVNYPEEGDRVQNLIILALKSDKVPEFTSNNPEFDKYLKHLWTEEIILDKPILTDDFAPVDYYINKII